MLGFDLQERAKNMYEIYCGLSASNGLAKNLEVKSRINFEFGGNIEDFLKKDYETQKKIYLEAQAKKENNYLSVFSNKEHLYRDDLSARWYITDRKTVYTDRSDEVFEEIVKNYKQYLYKEVIDVDDFILKTMAELTELKKQDLTNPSVKKRINGCYDLIRTQIKNGYNIYPLMDFLNTNVDKLKKEDPKACKKGGESYNEIVAETKAVQTLEMLEMNSPYVQFINAGNQLGELIREQKNFEQQGKFEEADRLDDKIVKFKEQLMNRFKSYDIDFLEQFLKDRKNYLKNDSTKYDEFVGSMEVLKTVNLYKQREKLAQQNQQNNK